MKTDKLIVISEISGEEKKLVQNQLKVVLKSTYFNSAIQMRRFLEYIVETTLAGQGNLLKQYTIGIEALGYPDDFDPESNPSVRIFGGRLRKRLEEYYKTHTHDEIVISIPKGTYTPEFKILTNKKTENTNELGAESSEPTTSTSPRLALLSFSDKNQSKNSNRLLLQTADALAKELSRFVFSKLIVFSPYADKEQSHGIGHNVGTDYVLALYLQELPDKKSELVCRLAKTGSKEIIWSESYEVDQQTPVTDQHNMLGKITAVITDMHQGKLHLHWARNLLLNKESIPKKFQAIAYYRQYYDDLTIETFKEAINVCETALQNNPKDIIANILFSDLCRRDYVHAYDLIETSLKRGIESAGMVTHLEQDSHEAHFTMGQLLFSSGEWERSVEAFNKAREITRSHAVIEYGTGFYFCLMGRWKEGLSLVKKAMALSSAYPSWYHMPISLAYYNDGKYTEALEEAKKIVAPNIPHGPLTRCISYAQLGILDKAKCELEEVMKRVPNLSGNGKSRLLRLLGNEELTEKVWAGIQLSMNSK